MPNDLDLTEVDAIVARVGRGSDAVIPVLQAIQKHYRYLPEPALRRVCEVSDITPAAITGVSTFYSQFRHSPMGDHVIHVCVGTACHVKGAEGVYDALLRHLRVPTGEDTDPSGVFTVQKIACLGCCTLAPVVQIDDVTYGHINPDSVERMLQDFLHREKDEKRTRAHRGDGGAGPPPAEVRIGLGSCCVASGSGDVQKALNESLDRLDPNVHVKRVGCVGMCHQTPLLEVVTPDDKSTLYARVKPEDVHGILLNHFKPRSALDRIRNAANRMLENLYTDEVWQTPVERYGINVRDPQVAAFLDRQRHLATQHCGVLDPTDLEEYRRGKGFDALEHCLAQVDPQQAIHMISASGLRGRGGAGFPTGTKWGFVRDADGDRKYIVCNGDEGDPGAFMDRMLLESYPYRILEGMALAAFAVGAHEGVLYIRAEYPLAVQRVTEAISRCREAGLLGDNILGSEFSLHLRIMEGAGAFVCGEETALIASIEGRRGMPRLRPPFPAHEGLWGKPTLVNNCETYALVPWIMRNGADTFADLGTAHSKGTKVFSLAGKIARGGLIEVPMGITLRQIVEDVGGGIADGKRLKAVQVGGPSGGCVPEHMADLPVDYEALTGAGAMMGSGGLVVLDETDCIVDIARYFLSFTQDQSCGKCTFCRIGTRRMLDILERLTQGKARKGDLADLEQLAVSIKQTSLCGLGKTAPNPILSTLEYFRDEYEAHVQGQCPAGKCKDLIRFATNDKCIGCTICAQHCPTDAIPFVPYTQPEIDEQKCVRCGSCRNVCPADAVDVRSGPKTEADPAP